LFGRVKQLTAFARTLSPNRVQQDGTPFTVSTPDFYVVNLEFESGVLVRLTTNFYVSGSTNQGEGIEFHGDVGSLFLHSWFVANSKLEYADFGKNYEAIPLVKETDQAIDWARGLQDFCDAIQNGTQSRVTGDQAAHVVEILEATDESARTGQVVALKSTFEIPAPMDFAK
jgi:predicted dehydrogenase